MADRAESLTTTTHVPIAQLNPYLAAQSTSSIKAVVTLIWPYSSSNCSLVVLLAEPDFRLRRRRGQVRVQFWGSSARTVFKAGIGSGDEVILSLDGVEWVKDGSSGSSPGQSVEWELKFTERLLVQIQDNETEQQKILNIDHPLPEPDPERPVRPESLEAIPSISEFRVSGSTGPQLVRSETSEWNSPAFIKRARVSYGSLLDSSYDIFAEEDGTIPGKGRKRTRFGRESGTWRYSSRSVSPERKIEDIDADQSITVDDHKPTMADEGCQTMELEEDDSANALANKSQQLVGEVENTITSDTVTELPVSILRSQSPDASKDLAKLERHVDMQPPPMPQLVIEVGQHDAVSIPQTITDERSPPLSPRLQPVPSEALPLVSPLISSTPNAFHFRHPVADLNREPSWRLRREKSERIDSDPGDNESDKPEETSEAADLYGLSPPPKERIYDTPRLRGTSPFVIPQDAPQPSVHDNSDYANQYGHWQSTMAAEERLSRSISPHRSVVSGLSAYPEHIGDLEPLGHPQEVPYYRHDDAHITSGAMGEYPEYPDLDSDHDKNQPQYQLESGSRQTQELYSTLEPERRNSQNLGLYNQTARPRSSTGCAMSRSQSVHSQSEIVDLTEDSEEEEADEPPSDMQIIQRGEVEVPVYGESQSEHGSEDDEESLEDQMYDDEELEKDEDNPMDFRQGFFPVNHYRIEASEEWDGGTDDEEEDYEDLSDDEPPSAALKRPLRSEPEVIDLLSSDDEDAQGDEGIVDQSKHLEEPDRAGKYAEGEVANHLNNDEYIDAGGGKYIEEEDVGSDTDDSEDDLEDEKIRGTNAVLEDTQRKQYAQYGLDGGPHNEASKEGDLREVSGREEDVAVSKGEELDEVSMEKGPEEGSHEKELEGASEEKELEEVSEGEYSGGHDREQILVWEPINRHTQDVESKISVPEHGRSRDKVEFDEDEHREVIIDDENSACQPKHPLQEEGNVSISADRSSRVVLSMSTESERPETKADKMSISAIIEARTSMSPALVDEPGKVARLSDEVQPQSPGDRKYDICDVTAAKSLVITTESSNGNAGQFMSAGKYENNSSAMAGLTNGDVAYPVLPMQQTITTTKIPNDEKAFIEARAATTENGQLPTPDATQLTSVASPEASFGSPIHIHEQEVGAEDTSRIPNRTENEELEYTAPTFNGSADSKAVKDKVGFQPATPRKQTVVGHREQRSASTGRSSSIGIDDAVTPGFYDASAELVLSGLQSPPKRTQEQQQSPEALPVKLTRSLRTDHGYFTPLKLLRVHLGEKIDILAIATTQSSQPQRAKGGPRHFLIRFNVTDQSTPNRVTEIQIFRPHKIALPVVHAGDGVLLRQFLVKSEARVGFALRSHDASSWVVFKSDGQAEVPGPPVEFGDGEQEHMATLQSWYANMDTKSRERLQKVNVDKGTGGATAQGKVF